MEPPELPAHDVPPGFVADVLADGLALAAGEMDVDAALRLAQLVAVWAAGLGGVLFFFFLVLIVANHPMANDEYSGGTCNTRAFWPTAIKVLCTIE